MARQIIILGPTDVKPGSVMPDGKRIEAVTLHERPASGLLVAAITLEDGKVAALSWPLGYGWTVDGRTAPTPEPKEE